MKPFEETSAILPPRPGFYDRLITPTTPLDCNFSECHHASSDNPSFSFRCPGPNGPTMSQLTFPVLSDTPCTECWAK
ncbi:hypothetical protein OESDEN_20714 [Oesophagostomum dentatum]|uniref:Uncharacterized protein n=1 Tax=Oesophagostomum dentatum TaxID=61180 RepID=A0A0B1S412_OESDE|nr:hypothetical protein OESDEN_20714 [Oesophagostomum dentatum]